MSFDFVAKHSRLNPPHLLYYPSPPHHLIVLFSHSSSHCPVLSLIISLSCSLTRGRIPPSNLLIRGRYISQGMRADWMFIPRSGSNESIQVVSWQIEWLGTWPIYGNCMPPPLRHSRINFWMRFWGFQCAIFGFVRVCCPNFILCTRLSYQKQVSRYKIVAVQLSSN